MGRATLRNSLDDDLLGDILCLCSTDHRGMDSSLLLDALHMASGMDTDNPLWMDEFCYQVMDWLEQSHAMLHDDLQESALMFFGLEVEPIYLT